MKPSIDFELTLTDLNTGEVKINENIGRFIFLYEDDQGNIQTQTAFNIEKMLFELEKLKLSTLMQKK